MSEKIKNMFGTDGIRARVGSDPLTSESLQRLGNAIALWAREKYGDSPALFLAFDPRYSQSFIRAALKTGLLRHKILITDGVMLPTPAVVKLLQRYKNFCAGIIISASHNPHYDNGIKIVDGSSGKITHADEERITELFNYPPPNNYDFLGKESPFFQAQEQYVEELLSYFVPKFLVGKKIVLDCAHGATHVTAPLVFHALGATTILINHQPDGWNINDRCGALYPDVVQRAVLAHQADIGFSFDGDGDRLVAVSHDGDIKDGDDILALLLHHPRYQNTPALVGTVMTNQGLESYLHAQQKTLVRVPVGDKYVAQMLNDANLELGGEPSGHIIMNDYLSTGDGIFVAVRICETLALLRDWSMKTFVKFPQILINLLVGQRRDLQDPDLSAIVNSSRALLVRGRLIVRYSGTEPLLRIMVEDDDHDRALFVGTDLSKQLQKLLS